MHTTDVCSLVPGPTPAPVATGDVVTYSRRRWTTGDSARIRLRSSKENKSKDGPSNDPSIIGVAFPHFSSLNQESGRGLLSPKKKEGNFNFHLPTETTIFPVRID